MIDNLLKSILQAIGKFLKWEDVASTDNSILEVPLIAVPSESTPEPSPLSVPVETTPAGANTAPETLLWDTPSHCYHSTRVLADEMGLTLEQKNLLCAVIMGESMFKTHAKNINYAFRKDGTKYVSSTDFGICQWNDYWHGKEISPYEAEFEPEKAVRLMITYLKRGQIRQWCAFTNGSYQKWLSTPLLKMTLEVV